MLCVNPWLPQVAAVGSLLVFQMSFVTLSFLITTPECWVPALGDAQHGFPDLSGAGRLVIKDAIMMGAALVTMADSAKAYLRKQAPSVAPQKIAVKEERRLMASALDVKLIDERMRPLESHREMPARNSISSSPLNLNQTSHQTHAIAR